MYTHENAKSYTGTKTLMAWPATREEYCHYRGWTVPGDENPEDDGFLVEYAPDGVPNHPNHKGYISWSPATVFHKAYRMNNPEEIAAVGTDITAEGHAVPEGEHMVDNPYLGKDQRKPHLPREHRDNADGIGEGDTGEKRSETGAAPGNGPNGDEPLGGDVKDASKDAREAQNK